MDVLLEFTDGLTTTSRTWFANGTAGLTEIVVRSAFKEEFHTNSNKSLLHSLQCHTQACRIKNRSLASASNTDCDSDRLDGVPTECVVDVVQQVIVDWMSV